MPLKVNHAPLQRTPSISEHLIIPHLLTLFGRPRPAHGLKARLLDTLPLLIQSRFRVHVIRLQRSVHHLTLGKFHGGQAPGLLGRDARVEESPEMREEPRSVPPLVATRLGAILVRVVVHDYGDGSRVVVGVEGELAPVEVIVASQILQRVCRVLDVFRDAVEASWVDTTLLGSPLDMSLVVEGDDLTILFLKDSGDEELLGIVESNVVFELLLEHADRGIVPFFSAAKLLSENLLLSEDLGKDALVAVEMGTLGLELIHSGPDTMKVPSHVSNWTNHAATVQIARSVLGVPQGVLVRHVAIQILSQGTLWQGIAVED